MTSLGLPKRKHLVYFYNLEKEIICDGAYVNQENSYTNKWYLIRMKHCQNISKKEDTGFSMCNIMSPANNDSFTSSFPIWMPFMSSCVISMAKTFSTMLNKSGDSGHPILFPILREMHHTPE